MTPEHVKHVMANGRHVEGWFSQEAALLFAWVDDIQREHAVTGDLFEIGVHRGRSAILLSHLLKPGEHLGVCDLFGDQSANVSRSGSGDRGVFESNLRQFGAADAQLRVFAKLSFALTEEEVGRAVRIFHIDGGHNADEALSDLRLAAKTLHPQGVIVVDDPFRAEWPGVTEAVIRFLDEMPSFMAVAVGFNKLLIARQEAGEIYARRFDDKAERKQYGLAYPYDLKVLLFVGRPLRTFFIPVRRSSTSWRARLEQLDRTAPWAGRRVPASMISAARRLLS